VDVVFTMPSGVVMVHAIFEGKEPAATLNVMDASVDAELLTYDVKVIVPQFCVGIVAS